MKYREVLFSNLAGDKPSQRRTWLRKLLRFGVGLAVFGVLGAAVNLFGVYLYLNPQIPDSESYRNYRLERPLRVLSSDGALISEFGTRRLIPIELEDVPQDYINGVIATEDKRFYEHYGIDWISLANDMVALVLNPEIRRGASTITMQLPRNVADLSREQTLVRKVKEMLLALKIEQELTKDEILELYINVVPFGKHSYGLQAASYTYYNKHPSELDLAQLAMLAGVPKRPEAGNPINGPEWAKDRRNLVLRRMRSEDLITQEQYANAVAQPLTAKVHHRELDLYAPYPSEEARRDVVAMFGTKAYEGYTIQTTIDAKHQEQAQIALRDELENYDRRYGYRGPEANLGRQPSSYLKDLGDFEQIHGMQLAAVTKVGERTFDVLLADGRQVEVAWEGIRWARESLGEAGVGRSPRAAQDVGAIGDVVRVRQQTDGSWHLVQIPEVLGALVAMVPQTGEVTAMVGGYSFRANQFNAATAARRQPGSGVKPFLYSAAINTGLITPASIFMDAPLVLEDQGSERAYRPKNDGGTFRGPMRLREALVKSVNLVSIRLYLAVEESGKESVADYMTRFGFEPETLPKNTQLAIGGGTMTATPLEMATAYATLANGGFKVEPSLIKEVRTHEDELIYAPPVTVVCVECDSNTDSSQETQLNELNVESEGSTTENPDAGLAMDLAARDEFMPVRNYAPRVVDERNVFLMNSMLRDVVERGTGSRAKRELGRSDLAGKTGTTDEATNTWFNGFHPELVASVWVGYDNLRSLGEFEYGSGRPLTIWTEFMRSALAGVPEHTLVLPEDIVRVRIDPDTGHYAPAGSTGTMMEYFRVENSPVQEERTTISRSDQKINPEDIF